MNAHFEAAAGGIHRVGSRGEAHGNDRRVEDGKAPGQRIAAIGDRDVVRRAGSQGTGWIVGDSRHCPDGVGLGLNSLAVELHLRRCAAEVVNLDFDNCVGPH